jgi:7-keto-8-aminopelargonate synthetase-like enzyme
MSISPPDARRGHPAITAALRSLDEQLDALRTEGRYRRFVELERPAPGPPYVRLADGSGRVVVDWCSNDYLGMSQHPAVVGAACQALAEHGVGSGGTRNIAGSHLLVRELEDELADLHGQEAALVFTSGFIANDASLRVLGSMLEGCVILSDERNHASMIDGIRSSRARAPSSATTSSSTCASCSRRCPRRCRASWPSSRSTRWTAISRACARCARSPPNTAR